MRVPIVNENRKKKAVPAIGTALCGRHKLSKYAEQPCYIVKNTTFAIPSHLCKHSTRHCNLLESFCCSSTI